MIRKCCENFMEGWNCRNGMKLTFSVQKQWLQLWFPDKFSNDIMQTDTINKKDNHCDVSEYFAIAWSE